MEENFGSKNFGKWTLLQSLKKKKDKLWRMYLAADLEKIILVNGQNWQEKN